MARKNSKTLSHFDTDEVKLERLRKKAKHEIGELDSEIPKKIQELKQLIIEEGDEKFRMHPPIYDDFYLKCLRARKYDVTRAMQLYKRFCQVRSDSSYLLSNLVPSLHAGLYKNKLCSILKSRDSKGRCVFIVRVEKWDPKESTFEDFAGCLFLLVEEIMNSVDAQLNGIQVIGDLRGLSLSHVRIITPSTLRTIISCLQDAYPVRVKKLHIYMNPYVFNMVWALIKPFLKEKIRKRFHFHGSDVSSLHRNLSIDPKLLPTFLGGAMPEEEYSDNEVVNRLVKKDQYFKDFFKYGYSQHNDNNDNSS